MTKYNVSLRMKLYHDTDIEVKAASEFDAADIALRLAERGDVEWAKDDNPYFTVEYCEAKS